ncbi:MAG TPA: tetratricopeptide repeat protein [Rhodopila sp.]|uniref:tetratricopeptide repeat protein n=1 Tax=Rhodopila sp. TaxID=2480087 RepID=UPI002C477637|nr:tetratricopeptide repeat protein [Rhodopila sp.]HVY14732.1 tetratricopeptide repeat protein [Rhodopila sp.]
MSRRTQQAESAFRLGQQCHMAGRFGEAEQAYRQVIAAMPRHAEAMHALGALFLQTGRPDAADEMIRKAIALRPAAAFQLTRANALLGLGRAQEAAACARIVLKARPSSAPAYQVLGHALCDAGDAEAAIQAYRQALRLDPALPDLHNNLGTALRLAGRLEEAERELRLAPPDPGALVNLSSVQKERGAFADAEATLRRALTLAPEDPVLLYNWSLLMNLQGRPEEAWAGWEQRFRAGAVPMRTFSQPQWSGDGLEGRTLLVHGEQGLGDVIQFARYVPAIEGRVLFEAPPRLLRLLGSNPDMPTLVPADGPLPPFDVVAPLLSLPARMRVPPRTPPYLFAEPARVTAWRDRIGPDGFRIGIAWQGFSGRHEDNGRSLPLASFAPLAAIANVRLVSLQKGEGEAQIAGVPFAVETLAGLDDGADAFVDTAAVMDVVDLVITSDTSIAHLAGALDRPVWVALRKVPDWRWMLDRDDSPWYPSMRLFRQRTDGDWTSVFGPMAERLARMVGP